MIGAASRDVGKTEFACSLIGRLAKTSEVVGVKITTITKCDDSCPRGGEGCGVCNSLKGKFEIIIESCMDSNKDTSRMKRAGAQKVYWLKVLEKHLREGITALLDRIDFNTPIVCESNRAALVIKPGHFIILKDSQIDEVKDSCKKVINFVDDLTLFFYDKLSWSLGPENYSFNNGSWYKKFNANVIILAGGKSTRMGEDKSLLPLGDSTMIEYIVDSVAPYFQKVLISSNSISKYKHLDVELVQDDVKNCGPLMGIYSALKRSDLEVNFIIACDSPRIEISVLTELFKKIKNHDAVIPIQNGRSEPLFALYKRSVIDQFEISLKNKIRKISIPLEQLSTVYLKMEGILNLNNINEYLEYKNSDIGYN
jgi:molybdopterin-guanine dinucleotide biosynthesis protein A